MSPNEPPDFPAARDHVIRAVVGFARTLRANGASVSVDAAIDATAALVEVGFDDRDRVASAMLATMVTDEADLPVFEEHFPRFWQRLRAGLEAIAVSDDLQRRTGEPMDGTAGVTAADAAIETRDETRRSANVGTQEREISDSRVGDARDVTTEIDQLEDDPRRVSTATPGGTGRAMERSGDSRTIDPRILDRFRRAMATRRGRRWRASPAGERIDTRRSLRRTLGTGGVAMSLCERDREVQRLRTCILVDVSQSVLDAVDRDFLLAFLAGLIDRGGQTRVFFFDTDIRDVTDAFTAYGQGPDETLAEAEVSWGGGTRIGDSLASLRRRWPNAIDHRTATIVVSDGLEVEDIDRLEREMARLARRSGPLVWFNPLATSSAYEPTCRGMAAAVPFIDGLFAFGGEPDLDDATTQLARHGPRGPIGYQHDYRERREAMDA